MSTILPKPPVSASEVPAEWTDMVRGMIRAEGRAIRAHSVVPIIEVKSLTTNLWHPLAMPSGGTVFVSATERDEVMGRIC